MTLHPGSEVLAKVPGVSKRILHGADAITVWLIRWRAD